MKYKKIVLAGGNGYLGQALAKYYQPFTSEIIILSRRPKASSNNIKTLVWDGCTEDSWDVQLEGADLLINLCGKNVNCRYTAANREAIISSRTSPTRLLGKIIAKLNKPPKCWINIVSATIYRHAEDHAQDEDTGDIGYGFSIDVCKTWESTFFDCPTLHTRKVALRMGIVLGRSDGAFPRLLNLVKTGLGGRQGNGQQYVSWIHEQDAARCTEWVLNHDAAEGVINCTAPFALKNHELMRIIRQAYGIPFGLPSPAWLLEIGAKIIGTETELILKSRWVAPKRLLDSGFAFQFAKPEYAVQDILSIRI